MNIDTQVICRRAIEALANGGAQGLILTVLILTALMCMRRSSAATRHAICAFALLLVAILPGVYFARAVLSFSSEPTSGMPVPAAIEAISEPRLYASTPRASDVFGTIHETAVAELNETDTDTSGGGPETEPSSRDASSVEVTGATATGSIDFPVSRTRHFPERLSFTLPLGEQSSAAVLTIIAGIGILRLAFLARQIFALRSLKRNACEISGEVQERFRELCSELNKLNRKVRLLCGGSESGPGPCALGYVNPAVILPPKIANGSSPIEGILRHELAHLARRDDWINLFQQLIQAVFFFHPAVWLLARRLNEEREIACDDWVLEARSDRREYALLLTEFAGLAGARRFTAVSAVWGRKTQIKRRISMILDRKRLVSSRSSWSVVGMVGISAVIATVMMSGLVPRITAQPAVLPVAGNDTGIEESTSATTPIVGLPPSPGRNGPGIGGRVRFGPSVALADLDETPGEDAPPKEPRESSERSVEQRLDRLEKMIEELVDRNKGVSRFGGGGYVAGGDFHREPKEMARVQREMDRASREAERFGKQFKGEFKAFNFDGKNFNFDAGGDFQVRGPKPLQKRMLEAQRKALEKQLASIDQRLQELEEQAVNEDEETDIEIEKAPRKMKDKAKEKPEKPSKGQDYGADGEKN